jgi:hypothetical protein
MDKAPVRGRAAARRAISAFAGLIACAGLGGCVEDGPSLSASAPATLARSNMIARVGVSPRGAPLAFTTIEGAPESVLARFRKATAAASRDIATTSPKDAAYLARGYITAYAADGGTVIAAVWDLYDKRQKRVQRHEDYVVVKSAAEDPWAVANDQSMAALAARSSENIAATLSNMPEAIIASGRSPVVAMDPSTEKPALPPSASAYR